MKAMNFLDAPIRKSSEDELSRLPFAKLIAAKLLEPNPESATVVGLTASWGSGKSSVANMVVEIIGEGATVVNFEPWMIRNEEALARELFSLIGRAILPKDDSRESKKRRAQFYTYAAKALSVSATGAGGLGLVVPGASVFGKALEKSSKVVKLAAEGLEAQAAEPSLTEARDQISAHLRQSTKPVVVVIDDIDRLSHEEVRTTFQIIKACMNFPNVRYLLLYDREQVIQALAPSVNAPEAFLEKIITQSFDLPEATKKQRTQLLDEYLTSLGIHENLSELANERIGLAFDQVLLPGLITLRHVKRFVSTAKSLLPGVFVDGFLNVDPADFLLVEYLRQYSPSVYTALRDEEAPQPGGRFNRYVNHKEWPELVKVKRKEAVDALSSTLKELTTRTVALLDLKQDEFASDVAEKRFCTKYWKPVYLGFCDARATIPESQWRRLVDETITIETINAMLETWSNRDRRDEWVTAICLRCQDIPVPYLLDFVGALFQWGDRQSYETDQFGETHEPWYEAVRMCAEAVMDRLVVSARLGFLAKAVEESKALVTPAFVVGFELEGRRQNKHGRWSRDLDISPLADGLAKRLSEQVQSGAIWEQPDVLHSIRAWHYLIGQARFEKWHTNLISDTDLLAKYLNFYMGCTRIDGRSHNWSMSPGLVEAIAMIDLGKLTEDGKWARLDIIESHIRQQTQDILDQRLASIPDLSQLD